MEALQVRAALEPAVVALEVQAKEVFQEAHLSEEVHLAAVALVVARARVDLELAEQVLVALLHSERLRQEDLELVVEHPREEVSAPLQELVPVALLPSEEPQRVDLDLVELPRVLGSVVPLEELVQVALLPSEEPQRVDLDLVELPRVLGSVVALLVEQVREVPQHSHRTDKDVYNNRISQQILIDLLDNRVPQ